MIQVPLLDLRAQFAGQRERVLQAVTEVFDSQAFVLGPRVKAFEALMAERCGVAHAVGVSSGTDALLVALMALEVGPGDEVVLPAYSFFATLGVVLRLGAKPVFVDIELATFNMDVKALEAAITPRTKAIMPVHLFGQMADMQPILACASRHGIPVIEDAAQALDARYCDKPATSLGDAGCLSFFPTKNLGAAGDAGMVLTDDSALAERLRALRMHGEGERYTYPLLGGNFRLDALQAAVLSAKLDDLDTWVEGRRRNAAYYRDALRNCGDLALPGEQSNRHHVYNQFVIRTAFRDALRAHLTQASIGTAIYYPVPLHQQPCLPGYEALRGAFPHSEQAARESLALPIFAELSAVQRDHVVASIRAFFAQNQRIAS